MRIKIDKIISTYYYEPFNKYVVFARIRVNGRYRFERLYFDTLDEVRNLNEGDTIDYQ